MWIGIRTIGRAGKRIPDAHHASGSGTVATGAGTAGKACLVSMTNPKAIAF